MEQGIFVRASVSDYVAWLCGYVANGGRITQVYDYEFSRARFLVARADFTLGGECGAESRPIITASESQFRGGDIGHNKIYCLDGYKISARMPWVPAFADPEFAGVPGYREAVEVANECKRGREAAERRRKAEAAERLDISDLSRFLAQQPPAQM